MRVLSLFSGGGGLDMAVERLWPDVEIVAFSETDKAASQVLARWWPDVPNLGDIRTVGWSSVGDIDVMVGGYPCQPWSNAGRRKGADDDRDGWPWFRDAIRQVGPQLVLLENVRGHVVPAGAGRTVGDLADLGYGAEWGVLRASDVGAPHRRERWFCVAYPDGGGLEGVTQRHGRTDRPGLEASRRDDAHRLGTTPDPDVSGPQGRRWHDVASREDQAATFDWGAYGPAIRRWESILGRPAPPPLDEAGRLNAPFVEWMMGWPEGRTSGLSRNKALKVLGNGVVPQQAVAAYTQLLDRVPAMEDAV